MNWKWLLTAAEPRPRYVLLVVIGVVLMMTLIDRLSELTSAYLLVVGIVLIALVLWFPKGILGSIRERWVKWLM